MQKCSNKYSKLLLRGTNLSRWALKTLQSLAYLWVLYCKVGYFKICHNKHNFVLVFLACNQSLEIEMIFEILDSCYFQSLHYQNFLVSQV